MNCFICKVQLADHSSPKKTTLEKFRVEYGSDFIGVPCPNCIKTFKQKNKNKVPINLIARSISRAIQADNYPAFVQAKLDAEEYIANCENEVSKAYSELKKKVKLKTGATDLLARLYDEMNKSPRASYYIRRSEADRYIANKEVRQKVFSRNNFKCINCCSPFRLTVDHVIPVVAGGTDCLDNLQTLCFSCNASKGGKIL